MSDTLRYNSQSHLLLTNSNTFIECCCEDDVFWEAVPCDAFLIPTLNCFNPSGCVWSSRKFISPSVFCDGALNSVCECNVFDGYQLDQVQKTGASNAATITLNAGWSSCTGIISSTSFDISARNNANSTRYLWQFPYNQYTTIGSIRDAINAATGNGSTPFSMALTYLPDVNTPKCLSTTSSGFGVPNGGSRDLASVDSYFTLTWAGQETLPILFLSTYDDEIMRQRIENRLRQLTGLSAIDVDWRRYNTQDIFAGLKHFYITFGGNLCGTEQDPIGIGEIALTTSNTNFSRSNFRIVTANYDDGWATHGQGPSNYALEYSLVPSGYPLTPCPYDDPNWMSGSETGFAPYDASIQCCPQRGCSVGANQNLPFTNTYGNEFSEYYEFNHLENTVYLSDGCYKINPFFFLFGEEGRFDDDPQRPYYQTFTRPNCDIITGQCDQGVPYNCTTQLFSTSFSRDCPWGVFGGYFEDIEATFHPTDNIFSVNFGRTGQDYSPSGQVRTRGEWTNTKNVYIDFRFYKRLPFYIGNDPNVDDRVLGILDPTTIATGIQYSTSSGLIHIIYNCSGKTVGNFLDDINAIKSMNDVSGYGGSCTIFNFCAASQDARSVPASKINNLSSELFDVWKNYYDNTASLDASNPFGVTPGLYYPDIDKYLWSGSDIYPVPKDYNETLRISPKLFNNEFITTIARQPPPCRYKQELPKELYQEHWNSKQAMSFWHSMIGSNQTILQVRNLDTDSLNDIQVYSSGRTVYINGYSGSTIVRTGIFPTNFSGSGYRAVDLQNSINNLRWVRLANTGTYQPVIANTGLSFDIWLDDYSWWDSTSHVPKNPFAVGAAHTTENWSYIEPLFDSGAQSIINGTSIANLKTWVRRRCGWYPSGSHPSSGLFEEQPRNCLPSTATALSNGSIDCDADLDIQGSMLLNYGCTSEVCKTEWYIKAQRCSCSTYVTCVDGVPTDSDNPYVTDEEYAPTLYVCAENIRRDCQIPFLIKVPLQFFYQQGIDPCYDVIADNCDNPPPDDIPWYFQTLGCTIGDDGNLDRPTSYMTQDKLGWCQYIDPNNPTLVKKSEITKAYPPVSYVWERTAQAVCITQYRATEFYDLFNPGCTYPQAPIKVVTLDDYTEDGVACFDPVNFYSDCNYAGQLYASFRAAVTNLTFGCDRDDIDCNLRCCGCYFTGEASGTYCCDTNGPVKNCTQTTSYYQQEITDHNIDLCCLTNLSVGGFPCCTQGGYGPAGGSDCNLSSCFGGFYTRTITQDVTKTISYECGCYDVEGQQTIERTAPAMTCSDCGGCTAEGHCGCPSVCIFGCTCGPTAGDCAVDITPATCSFEYVDPGSGYNYCCGAACASSGLVDPRPDSCLWGYANTDDNRCRTDSTNACGVGTITWSRTFHSYNVYVAGAGCGTCAKFIPNHTQTVTVDGHITVGDWEGCQNCNFPIPNIKDQDFIDSYVEEVICEYPNTLTLTNSSGIYLI